MLGQVKAGLIHRIIVKDFSRFARNHIDLGKHIEQIFPFMGVRFIAINDDYDSKNTDGGISGLGDQFKMLFYDLYSKDLSQKVKSSMVALKKQGKFIGGFAPFGYRKAPDDKSKLLIDEEAAVVVRRIFHLVLDEMSMYQICQVLNNESVPTPAVYMNEKFGRRDAHMEKNQNQYWTVGKIKRILDNEVYTGTLVAGKARAASVGSKKRVHIDEKDWIRVADTQEAIISREIFEKVQELRAKGFFFGTTKHESHVLCGKVICGSCGRNMAHSYQGIPKFLCNSKYFSPDAKDLKDTRKSEECKCVDPIHDKDLEGIVIGAIEDAATKATDTVRIREKASHQLFVKRKEIENEISKLTANIARSDEVLMKKYEEYLEGTLSREEYQD